MGTGKYLREKNSNIKIIGIEPTVGHTIQGLKNMNESRVPGIYSDDILTEKITIPDDEAFDMTRVLAQLEGVFVGMSSGAAVAGALKVVEKIDNGIFAGKKQTTILMKNVIFAPFANNIVIMLYQFGK